MLSVVNGNGNIPPGNEDPFEEVYSIKKKKNALFEMCSSSSGSSAGVQAVPSHKLGRRGGVLTIAIRRNSGQ